ncbi:type I restriction endonuclease subunit R [Nocardia africana]|uniref:Type I restriction enzyme endonuclease subunit n=1 Tax=Nocardia africana TaxID=134964 RepID=A0ABW6NQX0_9NOCA
MIYSPVELAHLTENQFREGDLLFGPEFLLTESPLIAQLSDLGWTHLSGNPTNGPVPIDPKHSGRESFTEPVLIAELRRQLHKINLDEQGRDWLDEARVSEVVNELTRISAANLLETNKTVTKLVLNGMTVDNPGGGRPRRVHFIRWDRPELNTFTVISQFRIDESSAPGAKSDVPDEVLLVNGIPLVVIECKEPKKTAAIKAATDQIQRYVRDHPRLFRTVQLTVATSLFEAKLGTFTSDGEHYASWRDPYPLGVTDVARRLGKAEEGLVSQNLLVAGVLHPHRLLDIVHNFVLFMHTDSGATVKVAPRYQQYRAVRKAIERLKTGKTIVKQGDVDERGGVVWHTQGSGKSLTMVFLVRAMRADSGLRHFKIVVVTDRKQLQRQLADTAALTGDAVTVVNRTRDIPAKLSVPGPGMVFAMIQKQRNPQTFRPSVTDDGDLVEANCPSFGQLNADSSILILVDEAHRSHSSALHMNLTEALPNAARIGFTGTPIIMGAKKKTQSIFGPFIDEYRLKDAEADGAIVPIFYEGRAVKGAVLDGQDLEDEFLDEFPELTDEQYKALQDKYATPAQVLQAVKLIEAKARNILAHYVSTVLPDGFKAQLVAYDRAVAVRYRDALIKAREELVAKAEAVPDSLLDKDPAELNQRQALLVSARRRIDFLRAMDFVPVISEGQNDRPDIAEWTGDYDPVVTAFKKPFPNQLGLNDQPPAFLIVKSMLLTGFDAPIEQVLYLDRRIREAELLQAIARVNRTYPRKSHGLVVDYSGIARELDRALAAYAAEDIEGAHTDFSEEIARLAPRRERLRKLFTDRGVTPGEDPHRLMTCVDLLADEVLRDHFEVELRTFLRTVEAVLPRLAAKPYLGDSKLFAVIAKLARARYRDDEDFDAGMYGEKVRELIDQHVTALGIDQTIPPVAITAIDYVAKVQALPGARTQASEMTHAIRHHIEVHLQENPVAYGKLQDRLDQILREYAEQWEQQVLAFTELIEEVSEVAATGSTADSGLASLSPVESALYQQLTESTLTDGIIDDGARDHILGVTANMLVAVRNAVLKPDFWRNTVAMDELRAQLTGILIKMDIVEFQNAPALADDLFATLKANKHNLASTTP